MKNVELPDLTIAQNEQVSNVLGPDQIDRITDLAVYTDAALAEGATFEVSPDGQTWYGAETLTAGEATRIEATPFRYGRVSLDAPAGAARTFQVSGTNPFAW